MRVYMRMSIFSLLCELILNITISSYFLHIINTKSPVMTQEPATLIYCSFITYAIVKFWTNVACSINVPFCMHFTPLRLLHAPNWANKKIMRQIWTLSLLTRCFCP